MDLDVPAGLVSVLTRFADERGWAVGDLLAGAGLSPLLLRAERVRITEDQLVALVQQVWRITDDEMFGIGRYPLPRGTFRLLCYALLGAPDLRGALDRLSGFLRAIPAIPLEVVLSSAEVTLLVTLRPRTDFDRLGAVVGLGATSRLLAWMLRRNLTLATVELPFGCTPEIEALVRTLDGPVIFDADRAALVLDRSWLGAPIMRDERDIEELVATSPRALLTRPRYRLSTREQVRRLLESGLHNENIPGADEVAKRLAMSPQTLRRRLADEGASVRELTEEVRRDAAIDALVHKDVSMAALAERLGFSEQSAFTRAFRRWTGTTPGAYRLRGRR